MMHSRFTNLLPRSRRAAVRRQYFFRLGTVAAVLATALVIAYAVLLLPTYRYLSGAITTEMANVAAADSSLSSSDDAQLSARLASLSSDAATLAALTKNLSVTTLLRAVLAVPSSGIRLTNLSYAPGATQPGVLTLAGVAATRDALRQYQAALEASSFAANVDLPVSAFAKDIDAPFTIVVTLVP